MKRTLLFFIFALLATSLLLAAGGKEQDQSAGGGSISVMVYTSAASSEKVKDASRPFMDKFKTNVEMIITPLSDYDQKMATMIAGNSAPDVYWVAEYAVPQYYEQGLLLDLSEFMNDKEWDWADFITGQQNHYLYGGKLMGVPFSGQQLVMFYNKTMFQKAGLKTPTELLKDGQWTVEAMLDAAVKLSDSANGVFGIDFTRNGDWANWDVSLTPVTRLFGGKSWTEDYKKIEINSPASVKGLQAFYDLIFTNKSHPMPGTKIDFKGGKLAMSPDLFNMVRTFENLDFEWDAVPMPYNINGTSTGWSGSAGYAVYPKGRNIPLAKEYVKHITSKWGIAELMHVFGPTRYSVVTSSNYKNGNNGQFVRPSPESFDRLFNVDVLAAIPVKQPHPKYAQVSQAITVNLEAMYTGAVTPKAAADAMAREMQPFMNK
ncbi:sugar ABC transporter substrate-binding protein [Treponema sp. OttesenSCG-928-L16]|nr:sugar ABC transporter substrate-binding protein [Treponema sp. OttesenSCG-928-L16]